MPNIAAVRSSSEFHRADSPAGGRLPRWYAAPGSTHHLCGTGCGLPRRRFLHPARAPVARARAKAQPRAQHPTGQGAARQRTCPRVRPASPTPGPRGSVADSATLQPELVGEVERRARVGATVQIAAAAIDVAFGAHPGTAIRPRRKVGGARQAAWTAGSRHSPRVRGQPPVRLRVPQSARDGRSWGPPQWIRASRFGAWLKQRKRYANAIPLHFVQQLGPNTCCLKPARAARGIGRVLQNEHVLHDNCLLLHPLYLCDPDDLSAAIRHSLLMNNEVDGGRNLLANRAVRQVETGHEHERLHTCERVARAVRVQTCHGAVVTRVHRLQHVQRLWSTYLAD